MTKYSSIGIRMKIACIFIIFAFAYVAYSFYNVQIIRHEELYAKAKQKYTAKKTKDGIRGEIYDRDGNLLVGNEPCSDIFADPSIAGDSDECMKIAQFFASNIGADKNVIYNRLMEKTKTVKNDDGTEKTIPNLYAVIQQGVEFEKAELVKKAVAEQKFKGIAFKESFKRNYPKQQLLANILGFTNIDRDQIVAVIGLEKFFDRSMTSKKGVLEYERSRDGIPIAYGKSDVVQEVQDGLNIYLTVREPIQAILEEELDKLMEINKPTAAYAIMADPYTGDIIAVAQRPTFNPNDRENMNPLAWRNRIAEDTFEPGSIMKPFAVAGALDRGIVRPETRFDCENGKWFFAGKILKDSHPLGTLSVSQIIQKSSNIGTAKIAVEMGARNLDETLRSFGFGKKTGVPLKPETSGIYRPLNKWDSLSISRFPIGQGLAASPLQLVRGYCMLANGGHPIDLRLVDRIQNPQTGDIERFPVKYGPSIYRDSQTHDKIVSMMKLVTQEGGTATVAAVKGYYVAGKTGTSQKFVDGAYSKSKYCASFVGFVPADNPRFVLLVTADEPTGAYYGGAVSGPYFKSIAERTLKYLNIMPDYDIAEYDAAQKAAKQKAWAEQRAAANAAAAAGKASASSASSPTSSYRPSRPVTQPPVKGSSGLVKSPSGYYYRPSVSSTTTPQPDARKKPSTARN